MIKAIIIVVVGLIAIYLLVDYSIINLEQTEGFVSKVLDWGIDKYLKAKEVLNW